MYAGAGSPDEALNALKQWFRARAEGIVEGRNRALAEGIGGMRVHIAPEFNTVHMLHDRGFKSVLYDVLPFVMFDYVSYSAWESIDSQKPADTLYADLDTIRDVVGSTAIIIGEVGFSRARSNGEEVQRTTEVIAAALDWGVAYAILWELYDADGASEFGLFDLEGRPTPLAFWFHGISRK
jgi:hypothetical protein